MRFAKREQRHNGRVAQVCKRARLAQESFPFLVVPRALAAEHLYGDEPVEITFAREVHGAERSGA